MERPAGTGVGPRRDTDEPTGVDLRLLDALRAFMTESLMVLDEEWTVRANLAPPGGLIGRGIGLGLHTLVDMHPDDALEVMNLGLHAFATSPGWYGSKVVRMRTGDGTYGRYEIAAFNRFDDPDIGGMVVRTREVPEDVTEDWWGDRPATAVRTLAELLPIGVLLLDANANVVFANANACGMLGREPEVLKDEGLLAVVESADRPQVERALAAALADPARQSCTVALTAGPVERVQVHVVSEGAPGLVTSLVVTLEDVTERHRTQRELEARANRDPLTGLWNRVALSDLLHRRFDGERPTLVAYLDLDGFKEVNDTWGHERGDEVLVAVADSLVGHLGGERTVARLGGDEFIVVGDPDDPMLTSGWLSHVVAVGSSSAGVAIGCCVGSAVRRHDETVREVLHRADQAMYEAKAARRRR
ncbi:MAG: sensor domain-containing diguanylate cyclase [Acidimicrobiales bacterium]|nr:sensor domain-containing diguanylate cyclase [Acidimicrobiales bacterium]